MEYAIVDIETTGSYANGNGITEIAILIHNGQHVIDKFHSLVNPGYPIPYHIQVLTGISEDMVADAPYFSEIAQTIFGLLHKRVFVAHNVNFDYSFVTKALQQAGYTWKAPKLCTVRLARKIIPNLASYSLGKLCNSLDIPIYDRHRALGDAQATVVLFERLLREDAANTIDATLKKTKEHRLPTHIDEEDFQKLPATTGIYIFRDKSGKVIYVGKAINIKSRVLSHFTGTDGTAKRQSFINEICTIDFEESGTELMALLMECQLIKQYWPRYNHALKRFEPKFGLFQYQDQQGYIRLLVSKFNKNIEAVQYFERAHDANGLLVKLIQDYKLESFLCTFYTESSNPKPRINYEKLPTVSIYNQKVALALSEAQNHNVTFTLLDKGRNLSEQSYIHYKDNRLYAFGFIANDDRQSPIDNLIAEQDRCTSNYYMNSLVLKQAKFKNII